MKSHEILDQFDKTIKSYIKMFEAVGLPASSFLPHPGPAQVGRGGGNLSGESFLVCQSKRKENVKQNLII